MSLDFLKQIKIDESLIPQKKTSGGGHRKEWSPTADHALRVWKDGSVFPSAGLVERFQLEYAAQPITEATTTVPATDDAKPEEKWIQPGNALDIFASADFPVFKTPRPLILANITAKSSGRADVFAQVERDEEGKPKTTVIEQGSNTFGKKDLIPMIKEVYGIELNDETPFVDLIFIGQDGEKATKHFSIEKGFAFIPKTTSRGKDKGAPTVQRREDPWIFILMPANELAPKIKAQPGAEPVTQP